MVATTLNRLLTALANWFEKEIPTNRLNNDFEGRKWLCKSLSYSDKFTTEDLQNITDRSELNQKYNKRFHDDNVKSRKGISEIKIEISALYSFQKCFTQRFKGRMHFYRDDLSQKGKRNMIAVGQAFGMVREFKQNLDS
jgi:hypothetical protein